MVRGIVYAIIACMFWSLIFIVPQTVTEFSSLEVVLGRYIVFGIISALLLFRKGLELPRRFPPRAWALAFLFSLMSNIAYYTCIVVSMKLASPPVTVAVVGVTPVVLSLYGNWHVREISYTHMIIPCTWILIGIAFVNYSDLREMQTTSSVQAFVVGFFLAIIALSLWVAYAVHNARFLKRHPELPSENWVLVIGLTSLICSVVVWILNAYFEKGGVDINHYLVWTPALQQYLRACLILGIFCSWIAFSFWNQAALYLPVSMLGPMVIFECLFGMVAVYIYEWRLPTTSQLIGIVLLLTGTCYALYTFKKKAFKT